MMFLTKDIFSELVFDEINRKKEELHIEVVDSDVMYFISEISPFVDESKKSYRESACKKISKKVMGVYVSMSKKGKKNKAYVISQCLECVGFKLVESFGFYENPFPSYRPSEVKSSRIRWNQAKNIIFVDNIFTSLLNSDLSDSNNVLALLLVSLPLESAVCNRFEVIRYLSYFIDSHSLEPFLASAQKNESIWVLASDGFGSNVDSRVLYVSAWSEIIFRRLMKNCDGLRCLKNLAGRSANDIDRFLMDIQRDISVSRVFTLAQICKISKQKQLMNIGQFGITVMSDNASVATPSLVNFKSYKWTNFEPLKRNENFVSNYNFEGEFIFRDVINLSACRGINMAEKYGLATEFQVLSCAISIDIKHSNFSLINFADISCDLDGFIKSASVDSFTYLEWYAHIENSCSALDVGLNESDIEKLAKMFALGSDYEVGITPNGVLITPSLYAYTLNHMIKIAELDSSDTYDKYVFMSSIVALILGYRLGLRRSEVRGLLIEDLANVVSIRANSYRRLKSPSAERLLSIRLFTTISEINFIQEFCDKFITKNDPGSLVFSSSDGSQMMSVTDLFDRPVSLLSKALGLNVRFHDLRRSFATYTFIRLNSCASQGKYFPLYYSGDGDLHYDDISWSKLQEFSLSHSSAGTDSLYVLRGWLGHADDGTSIKYYVLSSKWVCARVLSSYSVVDSSVLINNFDISKSQISNECERFPDRGYSLVDAARIIRNRERDSVNDLLLRRESDHFTDLSDSETRVRNNVLWSVLSDISSVISSKSMNSYLSADDPWSGIRNINSSVWIGFREFPIIKILSVLKHIEILTNKSFIYKDMLTCIDSIRWRQWEDIIFSRSAGSCSQIIDFVKCYNFNRSSIRIDEFSCLKSYVGLYESLGLSKDEIRLDFFWSVKVNKTRADQFNDWSKGRGGHTYKNVKYLDSKSHKPFAHLSCVRARGDGVVKNKSFGYALILILISKFLFDENYLDEIVGNYEEALRADHDESQDIFF